MWSRHILHQFGALGKDKGHILGYRISRVVDHHILTVNSKGCWKMGRQAEDTHLMSVLPSSCVHSPPHTQHPKATLFY